VKETEKKFYERSGDSIYKMANGGQAGRKDGIREIVFVKEVNPGVKVTIKVQSSRILEIDNPRKVHFPFHKGQMFQMNVQEWARVNGYSMDGKSLQHDKKIFGIRTKDIPPGHEWRHIYPHKFRADGGEAGDGEAKDDKKPRHAVFSSKQIFSHPTSRMDASYHIGKSEGKNAYKKNPDGTLTLDDINGKIMMNDEEVQEYNMLMKDKKALEKKIEALKNKTINL
jgi:hypothetical protein